MRKVLYLCAGEPMKCYGARGCAACKNPDELASCYHTTDPDSAKNPHSVKLLKEFLETFGIERDSSGGVIFVEKRKEITL